MYMLIIVCFVVDVALDLVEKYPSLARLKVTANSALKSITAKSSVYRRSSSRKLLIFPRECALNLVGLSFHSFLLTLLLNLC